MSRKKKVLPILENVTILDVAAEGKAVARVNDMVVFVQWAVPGDVVDLQVTRKKHSYCEARIMRFIEESPLRIKPRCQHFGICGGCKWQNLPYSEQIKAKQKQVYDQLHRIGKIPLPEFNPILGSVKQFEYRNKLEFGFSNKRWLTQEEVKDTDFKVQDPSELYALGFHITGAFDKIYPIEECCLMDPLHNKIRNTIRDYALEHKLTFFDLRSQHGLLRDMMIRCSNTGEWMLVMQFKFEEPGDEDKAMALMQFIGDSFPQITCLMYVDNQKCNDTFGDQEVKLFKGNDHIFLEMEGLKFKVGPKSFYQTNTEQAYILYKVVRSFTLGHCISPDGKSPEGEGSFNTLYDLYTGTGTIANFCAKHFKKVIGIEYVEDAIKDARVNSEINGIDNTLFYAGDMKDILTDEFVLQHGRPDVIITDPPRAGMHEDVVNVILNAEPKRIVYVSCNPATQARDLQLLDVKYKVEKVQPVDMFPHTPHVENVVLLEKR